MKSSYRYLIFLILLNSLSFMLNAQTDKEFWFVAPEVSVNHGDNPIYLRISTTDQAASVVISQPANVGFVPITQNINVNSTATIDLTARITSVENNPPDAVLTHGLLIESDVPVTAYYEVASGVNPAIYTLKGKNALGTEFVIPSQNMYHNNANCGAEAIDIVATEDGTTQVTITPTNNVVNHLAGVPFTITLTQKGQTYSIRSINTTDAGSLGGTIISSTKKIAVTVMDDSIFPPSANAYDEIGDQIVPVEKLGNEYIVIKGYADYLTYNYECVYIMGTADNTDLYFNGSGTPNATINRGQNYSKKILSGENTLYIKSSDPVYVYHLSGDEAEFGAALIPPLYCTGSKQVGFVRTSINDFNLMILTEDGNQGNFLLNGSSSLVTAGNFLPVAGTNNKWYYARMAMTTTQIPNGVSCIIKNTTGLFHFGILNNLGASAEYGYYSDYGTRSSYSEMSFCQGDSAVLEPTTEGSSYLWVDSTTNDFKTVKDEGLYWVVTDFGYCDVTDTFVINYHPIPVANFTPDPEIASLTNSTIEFINNSANADNCTWYFGDGDSSSDCSSSHKYNSDGYYNVTLIIKTNEGCTDTIVQVIHIVEDSLTFTNVFTPNGDGVNDYFEIKNIEKYLSSNVVIIDRWGKKVYEANKYNNSSVRWDAKGAADGVYYYIVKYHGYLQDGEKSGTVTVIR